MWEVNEEYHVMVYKRMLTNMGDNLQCIHNIKTNVQNQCILLFFFESQHLHIKHMLYHHAQTPIHGC
jgi:hypothetical protein